MFTLLAVHCMTDFPVLGNTCVYIIISFFFSSIQFLGCGPLVFEGAESLGFQSSRASTKDTWDLHIQPVFFFFFFFVNKKNTKASTEPGNSDSRNTCWCPKFWRKKKNKIKKGQLVSHWWSSPCSSRIDQMHNVCITIVGKRWIVLLILRPYRAQNENAM